MCYQHVTTPTMVMMGTTRLFWEGIAEFSSVSVPICSMPGARTVRTRHSMKHVGGVLCPPLPPHNSNPFVK